MCPWVQFAKLKHQGCGFLVAGRTEGGRFKTLADMSIPGPLQRGVSVPALASPIGEAMRVTAGQRRFLRRKQREAAGGLARAREWQYLRQAGGHHLSRARVGCSGIISMLRSIYAGAAGHNLELKTAFVYY